MKIKILFALAIVTALSFALLTTASAAGNFWTVNAGFFDNSGCTAGTRQCKTVQAAVNAANVGDFIFVAPGTYIEQVTVGKDLTLVGAGANYTTIQAPGILAPDSVGQKTIIEVNNGALVTLAGLTVNGPGPSSCASIGYGIYVIGNATLNLSGAAITNIRDNPMSGCQNGAGVRVGQQAFSQVGHATLSNVTVTNYQKGGIVIDGAGTTATVKNNTVTGVGATPLIAQNGIQISRGAVASVYGNVVTGNECDNVNCGAALNQDQSAGILLYNVGAGTTIVGNSVSANDMGVGSANDDATATSTTVSANTVSGNRYEGIYVGTSNNNMNATVTNNTITGPGNYGLAIEKATGVASGNTITGNGTGVFWYAITGGASMVANYNVVSGNTTHGADNATSTMADATNNWWGSASGPGGGNNDVTTYVDADPYATAQVSSIAHSTHEIGENSTFDTNVTVDGLYGVQFVLDHTVGVLAFQSGVKNDAGLAPNDWDWSETFAAENFSPSTPSAGQTELAATLRRDSHPDPANLTNDNLATWTYQCSGVGISPLVYDPAPLTGTILSDKNGFPIGASLIGDSVNCVALTADTTQGVIGLQGRLQDAVSPRGWNGAVVTLTCTSGDCVGYGPYTFAGTNVHGGYQIIKAGAGTGVATGTYVATVARRAYLSAAQSGVVITSGTNTLSTPTLLGGDVTGDNLIDIGDLSLIGGAFGTTPTADTGSDVNGDGVVNIFDLVLAGGNFYLSGPQTWP